MLFRVGRPHQHLQESERGRALLLIDVAPPQEERLLEKVVPLAVQADGGQPFAGDEHFYGL